MKINPDELKQTDRGRRVRFKKGDQLDKLTVMEYVGKRYIPCENSYDPVYDCLCSCGDSVLRAQSYLETRRKDKQCDKCAYSISAQKVKKTWEEKKRKAKSNVSLTQMQVQCLWRPTCT